jgi:uncharacterized protein (DUF1499 family)
MEQVMKLQGFLRFTPKITKILFALSIATVFVFLFSGYGYQWEIWSLGTAFTLLTNSAFASIGLIVLNLIALFLVYKSGYRKGYSLVLTGLVLVTIVFGIARYWQVQAQSYPPIHDITTNLENPPEFNVLVDVRQAADAPNPPEYAGEETARLQREAYPDLESLYYTASFSDVFNSVAALVESRNWELVNADRENGIVEATEKLPWFGFSDDVVVRMETIDNEIRVDMRSKSRIGRGDLGVNANRIRDFLSDLESNLSN